MIRNFFRALVCWFKGCRDFTYKERWIRIEEKKNKPPETLFEYLEVCAVCEQPRSSLYLTREEFKEICNSKNRHR